MLVVVQTYPAHFYQTLACLNSIRALDANVPVWVLVDNFSNFNWGEYQNLCQRTYGSLVERIISFSDLPALYRLRSWPWLRQQTNKLLIDQIVPSDEWLWIDGDVQLSAWPLRASTPAKINSYVGVPLSHRDPVAGEMSSQVLYYIRHMLGIEFEGFSTAQGQPITASHPPIKYMSREVLQSLRDHVQSKFGKSLIDIHLELASDQRMAACEWDLIECYRQLVLGLPVSWDLTSDWYETTWVSDRELGLDWFFARNIMVDPDIWRLLPEGKNYL